jgi:hypothetical protein
MEELKKALLRISGTGFLIKWYEPLSKLWTQVPQ